MKRTIWGIDVLTMQTDNLIPDVGILLCPFGERRGGGCVSRWLVLSIGQLEFLFELFELVLSCLAYNRKISQILEENRRGLLYVEVY